MAPGPALCGAASLPETCWDAGEGSSLQLHPQASVSVVLGCGVFFNLLDLVLFFNVHVCIFNCVFSLEVLLEMPS